jgi:50S ribosomal subunit-associated GTPase HflX
VKARTGRGGGGERERERVRERARERVRSGEAEVEYVSTQRSDGVRQCECEFVLCDEVVGL